MADPALKPNRGRVRGERLETRVTADQKSLIEHAAALQGRTVTDFVLTSVQKRPAARSKSTNASTCRSVTARPSWKP